MQINFDTNNEAVIKRSYDEALHFLNNKDSTLRETANSFGVCLKTTHNDLTKVLPIYYQSLAIEVQKKLDFDKADSVFRAGRASAYKKQQIQRA